MEDDSPAEDFRHMNIESEIEPPQWVGKLLTRFCPDHLFEEIEGDLYERFQRDVTRAGVRKAKLKYAYNALRFLRPGIILRNKFRIRLIQRDMIKNYSGEFIKREL